MSGCVAVPTRSLSSHRAPGQQSVGQCPTCRSWQHSIKAITTAFLVCILHHWQVVHYSLNNDPLHGDNNHLVRPQSDLNEKHWRKYNKHHNDHTLLDKCESAWTVKFDILQVIPFDYRTEGLFFGCDESDSCNSETCHYPDCTTCLDVKEPCILLIRWICVFLMILKINYYFCIPSIVSLLHRKSTFFFFLWKRSYTPS
jgi:hypothetical protein